MSVLNWHPIVSLIREDLLLSLQSICFLFGLLFRMAVIVWGQKGEEGSPLYISSLYYMMCEDSLAHASWMVQEEHSSKNAGQYVFSIWEFMLMVDGTMVRTVAANRRKTIMVYVWSVRSPQTDEITTTQIEQRLRHIPGEISTLIWNQQSLLDGITSESQTVRMCKPHIIHSSPSAFEPNMDYTKASLIMPLDHNLGFLPKAVL